MAKGFEFDTGEVDRLAINLSSVAARTIGVVYEAFGESAVDLQTEWRRNATASAGKAARRYPKTIAVWPVLSAGIAFDIYPDSRIDGQANLGDILENGSPTSPPHNDGKQAADVVAPRLHARVQAAVLGTFEKTLTETGPLS